MMYGLMAQVTVTIGTGTQISTLVYSDITPYKTYYSDGQDQILITAAELSAAGLGAGPITSLGFNVGGTPDPATLHGFTISMLQTASEHLSDFFNTGWTQVFSADIVAVTGWNTHNFSTYFPWDGTSNIIFKICFNNDAYTANSHVYYTETPTDGWHYFYFGDLSVSGGCDVTSSSQQVMARPNVQITGQPLVNPVLFATPSTTDFGFTAGGDTSMVKTVMITGYNLTDDSVTVTASAGFEIAFNPAGPFSSSISTGFTTPTISGLPCYIRFLPTQSDSSYTGTLSIMAQPYAITATLLGNSLIYNNYCASFPYYNTYEDIFKVSLGTIDNSSDCITLAPGTGSMQGAFSNYYFDIPPAIIHRSSYRLLKLESGSCSLANTNGFRVYIDYNQDGDLTDPGENVYTSPSSSNGAHSESGIIEVPSDAALGNTLMRVVLSAWDPQYITACGNY